MVQIAYDSWLDTQWKRIRVGSACTQLLAGVAPGCAMAHALISRADYGAEAVQLPMLYAPHLEPVLAQVKLLAYESVCSLNLPWLATMKWHH